MSRRRDERGAVAIVVGITMSILVVMSAFVVDLGMQRAARRDMQTVADIVSIDLSRLLGVRTRDEIKAGGDGKAKLSDALVSSVTRNSANALGSRSVCAGTSDACYLGVRAYLVDIDDKGLYATSGGVPVSVTGTDVPDGVVVIAESNVAFALGGLTGIRGGGVSRSAVAGQSQSACFKVGSFALDLATKNSILAPLLGNAAATRVLSPNGIATAAVSLPLLATQLGLGTPQSLVTSNTTAAQLVQAYADLATASGDNALATQLGLLKADLGTKGATVINFGELLSLGSGNGSGLGANVKLLDLLSGGLIAANGVNAVSVPSLNVNVLGTTLNASLTLTEPPVIACDRGIAQAAQGRVTLTGTVSVLGVVRLPLTITVSLANASGKLQPSSPCEKNKFSVNVYNQTLANVRLQADILLTVLFIESQVGTIDTGAPDSAPNKDYQLEVDKNYTQPVETNSGTIGLDLSGADVSVIGLNVGALVGALAPLVTAVSSLLTTTLLPSLGVTTAGAELLALPTPTCEAPALKG